MPALISSVEDFDEVALAFAALEASGPVMKVLVDDRTAS